jgi:NADH-quinone oxidoreductase subunit E
MLNGADDLIEYLQDKLKIQNNQTTQDNKFHFKKVECLGACIGAPMLQINDKYYENLTKQKIDDILDKLK